MLYIFNNFEKTQMTQEMTQEMIQEMIQEKNYYYIFLAKVIIFSSSLFGNNSKTLLIETTASVS